jgi:hypothetical protein
MPEDADGVAIVAEWGGGPAPTAAPSKPRARARVAAADLATRLLAAGNAPDHPISATHAQLAELAPRLDAVEVALLAETRSTTAATSASPTGTRRATARSG